MGTRAARREPPRALWLLAAAAFVGVFAVTRPVRADEERSTTFTIGAGGYLFLLHGIAGAPRIALGCWLRPGILMSIDGALAYTEHPLDDGPMIGALVAWRSGKLSAPVGAFLGGGLTWRIEQKKEFLVGRLQLGASVLLPHVEVRAAWEPALASRLSCPSDAGTCRTIYAWSLLLGASVLVAYVF